MSNKVDIYVVKAFSVLLNDVERERYGVEGGNIVSFTVGKHSVAEGLSNHDFVKLHTVSADAFGSAVSAVPGANAFTGDMVPRAELDTALGRIAELTDALASAQNGSGAMQFRIDSLTRELEAAKAARADQDQALDGLNAQIRSMTGTMQATATPAPPASATPSTAPADGSTGSSASGVTPQEPADGTSDPDEADAVKAAGLDVRHKGAGKYAVYRAGEQITDAMDKSEAEAAALELATAPAQPAA